MTQPPLVAIEGVTKAYGRITAVDNVSLAIPRNAFFALLGPSGCGKTTLLRMLGGFEHSTSGGILIDGEDMAGVQPNRRPVNMVFQSYAVFPHMTVAANIAYGLKVTGVPKAAIGPRVEEAIAMVRLDGMADASPTSSPAASASAWPWPGRSSSGRSCCCSTSRSRPSTRSSGRRCSSNSCGSRPRSGSPSSS
jgi:ABC-type Fe3+/spermidine/putrescine transport system ATPase subunit